MPCFYSLTHSFNKFHYYQFLPDFLKDLYGVLKKFIISSQKVEKQILFYRLIIQYLLTIMQNGSV